MNCWKWYMEYFSINDYTSANLPERIYLSFPHSVGTKDKRLIEQHCQALGYTEIKFYKKSTILIAFNNYD